MPTFLVSLTIGDCPASLDDRLDTELGALFGMVMGKCQEERRRIVKTVSRWMKIRHGLVACYHTLNNVSRQIHCIG